MAEGVVSESESSQKDPSKRHNRKIGQDATHSSVRNDSVNGTTSKNNARPSTFLESQGETPRLNRFYLEDAERSDSQRQLDSIESSIPLGVSSEWYSYHQKKEPHPSLLDARRRIERITECYVSQKMSPEVLSSAMETQYGMEYQQNTYATRRLVASTLPTLAPEDRLELALARDALSRGMLVWHAIVLSRIRKVLSNPISFLTLSVLDDDHEMVSIVKNSETTQSLSIRSCIRKLEEAFALEVTKIWESQGMCVPEYPFATTGGPYVHAQVVDRSLESSALDIPLDDTVERSRMMSILRHVESSIPTTQQHKVANIRESEAGSSQNHPTISRLSLNTTPLLSNSTASCSRPFQSELSQSRKPSQNGSCSEHPPYTVLTLEFSVVRKAVHEGSVSLIG